MDTRKRKVHLIKWPHSDAKLKCPVCLDPIVYHDPVYVGLRDAPVHEWCAVELKERVRAEGVSG